ncbi:hypothetical protein [Burkholderia ubonensis]|uniref:hypothetical protein n=1 Tax=Burkholderia ubonensis TaxID=101571 RepID=UPI0007533420|nr:hypothetical protein [Burkholderia ubonensis]KVV07356.1 hypothetical protein WK77_16335 [Burkholderia ubonensis]
MSFEYIRNYYGVPAERGRSVTCYGKRGVIVGAEGQYILVALNDDKSESEHVYHPTDEVVYGELVDIPALRDWECLAPWRDEWESSAWFTVSASSRSKARYKAFLHLSDVCDMDGKALIAIKVRPVVAQRRAPRRGCRTRSGEI